MYEFDALEAVKARQAVRYWSAQGETLRKRAEKQLEVEHSLGWVVAPEKAESVARRYLEQSEEALEYHLWALCNFDVATEDCYGG